MASVHDSRVAMAGFAACNATTTPFEWRRSCRLLISLRTARKRGLVRTDPGHMHACRLYRRHPICTVLYGLWVWNFHSKGTRSRLFLFTQTFLSVHHWRVLVGVEPIAIARNSSLCARNGNDVVSLDLSPTPTCDSIFSRLLRSETSVRSVARPIVMIARRPRLPRRSRSQGEQVQSTWSGKSKHGRASSPCGHGTPFLVSHTRLYPSCLSPSRSRTTTLLRARSMSLPVLSCPVPFYHWQTGNAWL